MEAYRVPFRFDRSSSPRFRFINVGSETLTGVTLTLVGSGVMPITPMRTLQPGDAYPVSLRGRDLERDTALIIRWLRPNGEEYVWRVVF